MLDETYIESLVKKRFSSESKKLFNGIGDDAAVCRVIDNRIVVSCDSHVEDVHFNKKNFTPEEISSRSLAIAVSDIVAMGAVPRFFLNSLLPHKVQLKNLSTSSLMDLKELQGNLKFP